MKITNKEYQQAADLLGVELATVKAVVEVESNGKGFLKSGEPVILFEGHIFHRRTGGKYSTPENANISYRSWTSKYYNEDQHKRLQKAVKLDRSAALESASWGLFQIMGFNYAACGFENVQQFIIAMYKGEKEHLMAFVNFIRSNRLDKYLKEKNWAGFARRYNGPGYAKNKYDTKLANAYKKYSK